MHAAQLLQCDFVDVVLSGHARSGREDPVSTDEIAALSDAIVRKAHRLSVESDTTRPPQTDAIRSALLTTLSPFSTK